MKRIMLGLGATLAIVSVVAADSARSETRSAAERGAEAVRGRPALNPPAVSVEGFDNLWKHWGLKEKPANYVQAVRERYGLHEAPYDNAGLPMGLHPARGLFGKGFGTDCLLCHAGAVAGQTIVGVGNTTLDLHGLLNDCLASSSLGRGPNFPLAYTRGTIDPVTPFIVLMSMRDAEMEVISPVPLDMPKRGICSDPPAWWQLKKKKIRDWTGAVDARAARLDMVNILNPFNSGDFVKKHESVYVDVHAFVMSVPAPKYPFPVDAKRVAQGEELFKEHCARCHGTYGEKWTYPDKVVPLDKIGTDPLLAESFFGRNLEHYNKSWMAQEKDPEGKPFVVSDTRGYQAPPLDGVWATAPYFHNGSVPTVYHVLNSKARPKVFTRSFGTGKEDYDPEKLGLRFTAVKTPDPQASGFELRKVYDTTQPGRDNGGHNFGDDFTEDERLAMIEYLKTL